MQQLQSLGIYGQQLTEHSWTLNTHLLSNLYVSLGKVALQFGPIGDGVLNFDDAGASRLKDGIKAVNDLHSAGFVSTTLSDVRRFGHDATKVLVAPVARVSQTSIEQQRRHLDLLSD